MRIIREPIHNWFGFSRRERRSTFTLLIIIVLIISLRFIVPKKNMAIKDITTSIISLDSSVVASGGRVLLTGEPFLFNPNTVSFGSLTKLGLDSKEANTLINYRNKGGRFRQPDDIKKVFGLEEAKAEILIPFIELERNTGKPTIKSSFRKQISRININNCDSTMLLILPGIGPVLSARIIKYRNLLGGFARIEQLKEVYGLPEETFNMIKGSLVVDTLLLKRINVNSASYKELLRHPYLEKYEVSAILKYRELKGKVWQIGNLIEDKLVTEEKAIKVGPYLKFE